jgi:nucleoside-diphosphate-sugar epimerase
MRARRLLVTGGAGFLGRALLRELASAELDAVRVVDLAALEVPGVDTRVGDVSDYDAVLEACREVDVVIHAASLVDWGHATRQRLEEVNLGGTRNVLRACREAGVPGLVYTSSMDVVCGKQPVVDADETTPYPAVFANDYARTKALAEQEVLAADGPDLATCALRPCGIYGEADPYHVARTLGVVRSGGLPFRIGDGKARFQHVYVGNVAHAHVLAAARLLESDSPIRGRSYFITDDSPLLNFFEFMEPIVEGVGLRLPPRSRRLPASLMLGIGALLEATAAVCAPFFRFTPTLTRSSVRFVCHDHTFVGDAARRDLGYAPIYGEAEAMERTIAYFARKA